MSKQSEAKQKQNYVQRPIERRCGTCRNIDVRKKPNRYNPRWTEEHDYCALGEFAVKRNAVCDLWEAKP